ncbi:hypothetical protein FRC03_005876 [Tulasnella sp. 419]|nr:hypothetical protein FRC03_005876 [Tulasnella sp. 419]
MALVLATEYPFPPPDPSIFDKPVPQVQEHGSNVQPKKRSEPKIFALPLSPPSFDGSESHAKLKEMVTMWFRNHLPR